MSQLLVRKLLIDLSAPFPANWCGGDAFKSAFFNALSMSFPVGEQFFIDSVRTGFKSLPESEQAKFKTEVQGFVGQEATWKPWGSPMSSPKGLLHGSLKMPI
jgi:predicted metal-dependent hydrolase